jgi:hypothetical protein
MINKSEYKTLDIIINLMYVFQELGDDKKKELAAKLSSIL